MQLEAVGVTQPQKDGPFQIRLKFGKQAYCVSLRSASARKPRRSRLAVEDMISLAAYVASLAP